jgi:nucleoside-diphosphate-sugar epimerase
MKTISIIGAGGFVGTRLAESLLIAGQTEVRAIVRAYRNFASLARFGAPLTIEIADAEDPAALERAIGGSATVVNLTTGSPASILRTTRAIFQACVTAQVPRLVHLSSAAVYGEVTSPEINDDSPPDTKHWMPYARAKAKAEVWLREQALPHGPEVVVLRPGIVWGVRSSHTLLFAKALLAKNAYLVDGGKGIFNSIYVDNLTASIEACHEHPGDIAGSYNVSDRETLNWRDFFAALAPALGCDIEKLPCISGDRFPWSVGAVIDYLRSLPLTSDLYHWLKTSLPESVKTRIKALLAGQYDYDEVAAHYATRPQVEREIWSLQRVLYKLSSQKFERRLDFTPPVSVAEGFRKTTSWLAALGYTSSPVDVPHAGAIL